MPPTLVHVAMGMLLAVALLGVAFNRRTLLVVALAAALPDLDAAISLLVRGATNAVLHSVFIPLSAAALLYWDTERRDTSWFRGQAGWYGVRLAWVAIGAYAVAGIGLDLFNVDGAAVLYPLSTRYFAIVGHFLLSTQEGIIQTYVELGNGYLEVASPGTMANYHVESWLNPTPGTDNPPGVERRIQVVDSSWQLALVVTAFAAISANWLVERSDR